MQRAILLLRALTLNKGTINETESKLKEEPPSVLDRLSQWSSKLLDKTISVKAVDGELEIDYLAFERERINPKQQMSNEQHNINPLPFGMSGRMALMNPVSHENDNGPSNLTAESRSIGPLPHIEPTVEPDLKTFKMILGGK